MANKHDEKPNAPVTPSLTPLLTRAQVAKSLNLSVSSVRRLEGDSLHPVVDEQGIRRFELAEVQAIARQKTPLPKNTLGSKALSEGEITALAFECFEQRQALAEVVIGLRLTADKVRGLRQQWRRGYLARNEAIAPSPNLPTKNRDECSEFFSSLPTGQETRISVARFLWDTFDETLNCEFQEFNELCGFVTFGPITLEDIGARYGTRQQFRVSAYSLAGRHMLWEFITAKGVV